MTVIDIYLDRQRPNLVEKQDIPGVGCQVSTGNNRKRKPSESLMTELQKCGVGSIFSNNPSQLVSMEGKTELFRGGPEKSAIPHLSSKKLKLVPKTDRPTVRGRRKSRWKLKFHHQALPPEYLRHYKQQERKRKQSETKKSSQVKNKSRKLVKKSVSEVNDKSVEQASIIHEETGKSEQEEPEERQRVSLESNCEKPETGKGEISRPEVTGLRCKPSEELLNTNMSSISQLNIDISQNKAFLENLLTNQIEINRVEHKEKKTTDVKNSLSQFNKLKNVKNEERHKSYSIPSSGKIMNYSDLPYMGEITLDGIKPRRGRKPKKADICHLIYKNYGQVFPGAPGRESEAEASKKLIKWKPEMKQINSSQNTKVETAAAASERLIESPLPTVSGLINHTEVQNRIINSLLEKRLTQEMRFKNYLPKSKEDGKPEGSSEEPLNLCVRDLQSLKIKLSRKHGNIYEAKNKQCNMEVKIKTEIEDGIKKEMVTEKSDSEVETTADEDDDEDEEDDLAPFNLVTTELRESSDEDSFLNFNDQITLTKVKSPSSKKPDEKDSPTEAKPNMDPNSVMYWPGNNMFLHPVAMPSPLLYYQRLPNESPAAGCYEPSSSGKEPTTQQEKKPVKGKHEGGNRSFKRIAPKASPQAAHVITKRKRSAIFIPPVPAENTANPTTEVSICKFKFTGGAKPSLQEKKMLSVDSGGNFRYYSGTGDKSMRGYEYFPRESLQQCQEDTGCSPSGVFLTASALGSGEKIPEEIGHSGFFDTDFPIQVPPPQKQDQPKLKNKQKSLKKPEVDRKSTEMSRYQTLREHLTGEKSESSDVMILPDQQEPEERNYSENSTEGFEMPANYFDNFKIQEESSRMSGLSDEGISRSKKSRKTRKSLAREKLEQTFKEKGFLIQTQQLESAEGATYCKFRQLRKFTRYLFRSWKDYLPGNVRDLSVDAGVENNDISEQANSPIKPDSPELQEKPF